MHLIILNLKKKVSTLKFEELNLHDDILEKLQNNNQSEATQLQKSIITAVRDEQSLVIKAEPGSDKYNAIAIAALEKFQASKAQEGTQVLIPSDDSESLNQVSNLISQLKSDADPVCAKIDPEGDSDEQIELINSGHAILLANPARLHELMKQNRYIFRHTELLVLDHFDEMIANDQQGTLKAINRRILSDYTSLICVSELDNATKKAALSFAEKADFIGFENSDKLGGEPPVIPGHLSQGYIKVPPRMKITTLMAHLDNTTGGNCIIFTASKRGTDRLYRILKKQRLKAVSLHYKLSDERRAQRFANFANGDVQYLLVSDISAADLDMEGVTQVINYDVPNSSDEYRYRAALVGTGKNNRIVSLVSKQDRSDISELQNELGQTPDEIPLPDKVKQKLKERKSQPRSNGQNGRGRNKNHAKNKKKSNELELPQPNYDQLSGGRSGHHNEEETGIVKFFKKLFS